MFRSNGLVAVEALKSVHSTFPVCFPRVDAVIARQWSTSPHRCASRALACCRAGLAVCHGNSHRHCHVRPPLLSRSRAALSPVLCAVVLPSPLCIATRLLPLLSHPRARVCALAWFHSVHVVAPAVDTPLMALRRTGHVGVNTRVLVR